MTIDLAVPSRRALILCLVCAVSAAACGGSSSPTAPTQNATWIANVPFSTTDVTAGSGEEIASGATISVDYVGWLYSTATSDNKGSVFDTSCPNVCTPMQFTVGAGRLIRGFEQGVVGMRVGGIRRVVIPPDLAYGSTGSGSAIPPNATIIFEIRANSIVTPAT
jgi:FKBP-type peptidyl-prolyl cis-trans isomerase